MIYSFMVETTEGSLIETVEKTPEEIEGYVDDVVAELGGDIIIREIYPDCDEVPN